MTTLTMPAPSRTQNDNAQPKACHCGPEAPCKKDGICRCKLVGRLQPENPRERTEVIQIEERLELEYDASHSKERDPQVPTAYEIRKHDYVDAEIVLQIVDGAGG